MKLLKRFEKVFSAVAFAEAGEFETARQIMKEEDDTTLTGSAKEVEQKESGKKLVRQADALAGR